jgi:hypothetical protein
VDLAHGGEEGGRGGGGQRGKAQYRWIRCYWLGWWNIKGYFIGSGKVAACCYRRGSVGLVSAESLPVAREGEIIGWPLW